MRKHSLSDAILSINALQLLTEILIYGSSDPLLLKSNVLFGFASDALFLTNTSLQNSWTPTNIISSSSLAVQNLHFFNSNLSMLSTRFLGGIQAVSDIGSTVLELRDKTNQNDVMVIAIVLHLINVLRQQARYRKFINRNMLAGHNWYGGIEDHPKAKHYRNLLENIVDDPTILENVNLVFFKKKGSLAGYGKDPLKDHSYIGIMPDDNSTQNILEMDLLHEFTHFLTDQFYKEKKIMTNSKSIGGVYDKSCGHTKDFYCLHHAVVARALKRQKLTATEELYKIEGEYMSEHNRMHEIIDFNEIKRLQSHQETSLFDLMKHVHYPYDQPQQKAFPIRSKSVDNLFLKPSSFTNRFSKSL